MALFSNLREAVGQALGGGTGGGNVFNEDLNWNEFKLDSDPSLVTDDYKKIGELVAPWQQYLKWGYGNPNQPENQGFAYLDLMSDSSTNEDGNCRFMVTNANDVSKGIVFTRRSETLRNTRTEYADGVPMPETSIKAQPQEKLIIKVKGDSAVTLDNDYVSAVLPVTRYMKGASR